MYRKIDFTLKDLDLGDIRNLDHDHEWEEFFITACGLDFELYFYNDKILTGQILEIHLEDIVSKIVRFKDYIDNPLLRPDPPKPGYWVSSMDDIYIGFQILGLLILMTGAYLPFEVYDSIMYSTCWEYDRTRNWSFDYADYRKNNLKLFRELIQSFKSKGSLSGIT